MNYSNISADSSQIISSRYCESAGISIIVDTGLSVSIQTELSPFLKILSPELIQPPPLHDNEIIPFDESEISRLIHLDSLANPILADIWRDEVNDEFVSS
jgi:hypothetical protein